MFELPPVEQVIYVLIVLLGIAAAVAGGLQLRAGRTNNGLLVSHLISVTLLLEAVLLIVRSSAGHTFPLTGLFESLIVLTLVFGLTYLIFGLFIQQAWFGTIMSWIILALIVLTAFAAEPVGEVRDIATRPWALAHGLAMSLGGAMIVFSAAVAYIYLMGHRRLKHGQFAKVLGLVPNLEKLKGINRMALRIAFILFSLGVISGIGMVSMLARRNEVEVMEWMFDPRILGVLAIWLLVGLILLTSSLSLIRPRTVCFLSFLILALLVIGMICRSSIKGAHDFSQPVNSKNTSFEQDTTNGDIINLDSK